MLPVRLPNSDLSNDTKRTLDCWREVDAFNKAVADAEKELFAAWK